MAAIMVKSLMIGMVLLAKYGQGMSVDNIVGVPPIDGAKLAVCDTSVQGQAWELREAGTWDVTATLVNQKNCLDVADRASGPGIHIRAWQCCCEKLPVCGSCGDEKDNSNQMYKLLNNTFVTTIPGLCLSASDGVTVGSPIVTQACEGPAEGSRIIYSATAPHLRVESNASLCVITSADAPAPPSPPSPGPGKGPYVPVPQACTPGSNTSSLPFCDSSLSIPKRIADLMMRMTKDEKITQLIGGIGGGVTPGVSRLGVPPYQYHSEGLHGLRSTCKLGRGNITLYSTLFPQVTAMAATGNLSLINAMASHMGDEARAVNNFMKGNTVGMGGGLNYWGPTMNIARDPRWGRVQESVSEDPWLNGAYASEYVRGFQGMDDGVNYTKAASCCKHFYAYSLESSDGFSRHDFNAIVNKQDLTETYNTPFAMCVLNAAPEQIMCSYNAVNGIPTCFDDKAQNGFLRDTLGFDGVIFSDCDAVKDGYSAHHYANSPEQACSMGIKGGCDVDCGATYNSVNLQKALDENLLNVTDLDVAIGRAMTMRMRAGMFDAPSKVAYTDIGLDVMNSEEGKALSLNAARESIVLLQNKANMLPLSLAKGKTIAVIGPTAIETQTMMGGKGDYCPETMISVCDGLTARAMLDGITVVCNVGDDKAAKIAADADVVFAAVGGTLGHEGMDRTNISLPSEQITLVQTLYGVAASKLVLVLLNGEPVALDGIKDNIATIVEALEGGQSGGQALAEMLFGDFSPSGVLPFTVYPDAYVNQVMMSNMVMRSSSTSPGHTYRFLNIPPQFPFGFGLSYTTFKLSWVTSSLPGANVAVAKLMSGFDVSVNVVNTGTKDAAKVVQLYVARVGDADAPKRSLVSMVKVFVKAGASVTATLNTAPYKGFCAFCVVDNTGASSIPTGTKYTLSVGDGANDYFDGTNFTAM
eukprot:m.33801 g.33801  ORF g.33801 m.33801 type:complete len:925 (+) comp16874_c0_seq1:89-2863(+)